MDAKMMDRAPRNELNSNWSSKSRTWADISMPTHPFVLSFQTADVNLHDNSEKTPSTMPNPSTPMFPLQLTSSPTSSRIPSSSLQLSSVNEMLFYVNKKRLTSNSRKLFSTISTQPHTRTNHSDAPFSDPRRTLSLSLGTI
jgi:hypothetical protein